MLTVFTLFWEFFKIGLFAVGGGPATLPFLMELTRKFDWFTMKELTNMVAVSESTPGPLGLNMATYAGFQTVGVWGGLVSTIGLTLPSLIVIMLIAKFLEHFNENPYVKNAFFGIRPTVTALIAAAVFNLFQVSLFQDGHLILSSAIIALVIFLLLQVKQTKKMHPFFWFLGAALIGIISK